MMNHSCLMAMAVARTVVGTGLASILADFNQVARVADIRGDGPFDFVA